MTVKVCSSALLTQPDLNRAVLKQGTLSLDFSLDNYSISFTLEDYIHIEVTGAIQVLKIVPSHRRHLYIPSPTPSFMMKHK